MRRVTFIVGLPGSGKTFLARSMQGCGVTIVDDYAAQIKETSRDAVVSFIRKCNTPNLVITDPMACLSTPEQITSVLKEHLGPDIEVTFIAFENDLAAAWDNCVKRADGREIGRPYVEMLSKHYDPRTFTKDVLKVFGRAQF